MSELKELISSLGADLKKEAFDKAEPCPDRCADILNALEEASFSNSTDGSNKKSDKKRSSNCRCKMTIALLDKTQIGKTLTKSIRAFKRHKRTSLSSSSSSSSDYSSKWDSLVTNGERLLSTWKEAASAENREKQNKKKTEDAAQGKESGLPRTVGAYKSRLIARKKEIYKDPPVLPPPSITIEQKTYPLPKRDKKTGELTFPPATDDETNKLLQDFHPNRTPEEVLRAGSFGGTYFRPITSAVTNIHYQPSQVLQDTIESSWIEGLDKSTMVTSSTYRTQINKYKVKCGGSLGMWESSGWISDVDPYGWFQWYCRFYRGRRTSDDARQISRWAKIAGIKGRFRSQLCNKCIAADARATDEKISPVIRQTLLHWGLELTGDLLERHRKRR